VVLRCVSGETDRQTHIWSKPSSSIGLVVGSSLLSVGMYSPIRDSQSRPQRSHVHCPDCGIVFQFSELAASPVYSTNTSGLEIVDDVDGNELTMMLGQAEHG